MNAKSLLESLTFSRRYGGQVERVVELPARPAQFGELAEPLKLPVQAALANAGITDLYTHQVSAIEEVRQGRSIVIVTGTASGKTLCYNIPVIEAILDDPLATALFVYPTKALAQDQLRGLDRFNDGAGGTPAPREEDGRDAAATRCGINFIAGTYDGDTPAPQRRKLRDNGQVILTNPDMLHQAILPHHSRWSKYFSNLKYVVLDEVHAYRGVFGSHLSNVMRRLQRICEHYGASPQFICCSATIANPVEHASRIVGHEMALVDDDGSPRGPKRFVLWNPPMIGGPDSSQPSPAGERRGPLGEAIDLMTALVRENVQTIAFVRTRLAAELISRGARDNLGLVSPRFVEKIQAYRGGYLPEERREIERRLASGDILGVASTNALELGIDIGSLDACLMVGYPGTIASAWQQAGRAGRGAEEALIFLIGDNAPIDQYLMNHSNYLFDQNPENAVVDPNNPHVAIGHIKSAAYELPIPDAEVDRFGDYALPMLEILEEQKLVKHLRGKWYWSNEEYPAATVNLRNIGGPVYNIIAANENNRVIGTMDEVSAFSQLHKHAVYLHDAQSYLVTDLDTENAIAYVEKRDLDYYTQAITSSRLQIEEKEEEAQWRECTVGLGAVTVTTTIPMFKKVKYHSRDSLGFEQLELPPQILETISLWLVPPQACLEEVRHHKLVMAEGLIGIANCLVEVAPMFVMCDVQDVGVVVDASNLGQDALFLYDRYPGGMGFSERCADQMEDLIRAVHEVISKCPCTDGCPSCVGAALPAFALSDIDSGTRGRIPDKQAALVITHQLLGLEPYVPRRREDVVEMDPEPEAEKATEETEAIEPKLPLDLRKRLSELRRKE
ncbi:MAG: DEAD/DEAH box helicase [Armatimonadia bacterium]